MSTNKDHKSKHGGILKSKSQFEEESTIDHTTRFSESDDVFHRKEAPLRLEEEFNESFKARQRRRSAGTILPPALVRMKSDVSARLSISPNDDGKKRNRHLSSEYCESLPLIDAKALS